jgi:hypothetical protein
MEFTFEIMTERRTRPFKPGGAGGSLLSTAFAAGIVFSATLSGMACGFDWTPPSGGYFECCDDSGYVRLSELLTNLFIPGEDDPIPLWLWYTSANTAPSPYVGLWHFGLLDMSLVQTGPGTFEMRDPSGAVTSLILSRELNSLDGFGWKGEIVGSHVKLRASCGWGVEFDRGKVAKITTPNKKSLVFNYTDGLVTSVTCDRKPLITLEGLQNPTLKITVNGKTFGIVKADQPCVQRVGKADVIRGTEKSLHRITGQGDAGGERSYTYPVDEKMRPMITSFGKDKRDIFSLAFDPQTCKLVRWREFIYTTRTRKSEWDTIELVRKNGKGEVESYYHDIQGGVKITQKGNVKHSEYRFTSGPAASKIRRTEVTVDGKVTHFQRYAYDEKGRPIRGQEDDDKWRFEYDDKNLTAVAWKNDKLLWKKTMDAKNRIVKVEYPDGKELRLAYPDRRPPTAELVCNKVSIVVQLDGDGWIKEGTEIIRERLK